MQRTDAITLLVALMAATSPKGSEQQPRLLTIALTCGGTCVFVMISAD
jgi:hypothetical protein